LFVIRRDDFLGFLEREPALAVKFITLMCQRVRWISERMEESVLLPLPVRLGVGCARWRSISVQAFASPRSNQGSTSAWPAKP
jgi:predicted DNA-binding transcriptional regulator AlpA